MIRRATEQDADAVTALEVACQGADAWSAWLVRDGVQGGLPTVRYLVAEVDGEVVGYAVASFAGDIAELQRIGVTPAARRTGLASVYAQDTWAFAEPWRATFGARVEQWRAADGAIGDATTTIGLPERTETYVSPKLAIALQLSAEWSVKASLGRAVRFPTVAELYQGSIATNVVVRRIDGRVTYQN